ncbi:MAG: hypothetical protein EBU90_15240 [Proteobacteria bacterium]|nr:hypothetical protein [Pseudomonadota bacterium]
MSTVKISQLPNIPGGLNANTSNSLFLGVDIPTGITGKFTATQLAERLYANNVLNVGDNPIVLPDVAAQFAGDAEAYLQVNLQNSVANGSADYVATADIGTDTTYYIDFGINNSNYNYNGVQPYKALDGYLIVAGQGSSDPGGNLMVGTITSGKEIDFVIGGVENANVVLKLLPTHEIKLTQNSLVFADGTKQNTAAASASFSQEAFATANLSISNNIKTNTYANSAYNKANNALANTSGIFAGDLTLTGNLTARGIQSTTGAISTGNLIVNGTSTLVGNVTMNANTYLTGAVTVNSTMVLANSLFSPTQAALTITASGTTAIPSNDGYMLHISGKNGVPSRIVADSYGSNSYIVFAGRAARGTVTSPSGLQANDIITRISSNGYGASKYQTFGVGRIDFVASENFTDANTGSRIEFWNCPIGSNTLNKIATFNGESAVFTGVVNPQKGFTYTPNNITSVATTYTVDFQRDSMVRMSVNDNMAITLQNYVAGKVVEVWITNSAAQNKTITHGCLANNATSKATSFTISSQSCAFLKYFSIDGDQANTFVAIVA